MAEVNKNIINFPSLLENTDSLKIYIIEQERIKIKENMIKGYKEMSQINISLSEIGLAEDIRELNVYETNLTGCEK